MRGDLVRHACLAAVVLAAGCGSPDPATPLDKLVAASRPSGLRVLLVGVDGATFSVMDPLLEQGLLPHLDRMIRDGAAGPLESEHPLISPAIWTTIATGTARADHGIARFRVEGRERLVASTDRRRVALWNVLSSFDRSVGVAGWWATWPAEPVNGWMLSDRMTRSRWSEWTDAERAALLAFPPELVSDLGPLVVDPADAPIAEIAELARFTDGELDEMRAAIKPVRRHGLSVLKFAYCTQRSYERMVLQMLERGQPDLTAVFLVANDPISHTFWHFYEPEAFPAGGVDPETAERLGRTIPSMYRHNDRYLGQLVSAVDENTVILVVSDHGFEASGELPTDVAATDHPEAFNASMRNGAVTVGQSGTHHVDGLFIAAGGPVRAGVRVDASIYDVAPTVLALLGLPVPDDMPGRVLEEIVEPAFWERIPIRRIESYEGLIHRERIAVDLSADDEETLEMLRALGYVR